MQIAWKMEPVSLGDPLLWADRADIAYQPIISLSTLRAHGFEALARLPEASPFHNAHALLDAAETADVLRLAERTLLTSARSRSRPATGSSSHS